MKLLQINVSQNVGSTGKIVEQIGELVKSKGWESYVIAGRHFNKTTSFSMPINNKLQVLWHVLISHMFDFDGLGSYWATKRIVHKIDDIKPDIIHLHVIHEAYINYPVLFTYLKKVDIPIVWTFHDCWAFTGHCTHFDFIGCEKWITHCSHCPSGYNRRKLEIMHNSFFNYSLKKKCFTSVKNMTIVCVSEWLARLTKKSFFSKYPVQVIHNGIDINVFYPRQSQLRAELSMTDDFIVIGVANGWGRRKGFYDFIEVARRMPVWKFIMIGNIESYLEQFPQNITTIAFLHSQDELAAYYSISDAFLNVTYEDSYPTVNLESIACGTPVVTYNTGGSPESIKDEVGYVVEKGNVDGLLEALRRIKKKGKGHYLTECVDYASRKFRKEDCFEKYYELYKRFCK